MAGDALDGRFPGAATAVPCGAPMAPMPCEAWCGGVTSERSPGLADQENAGKARLKAIELLHQRERRRRLEKIIGQSGEAAERGRADDEAVVDAVPAVAAIAEKRDP